jgi:hypothetical protein
MRRMPDMTLLRETGSRGHSGSRHVHDHCQQRKATGMPALRLSRLTASDSRAQHVY